MLQGVLMVGCGRQVGHDRPGAALVAFAMGEKYTICLVSTPVDWVLMRISAAPKMGRLVPEAERI